MSNRGAIRSIKGKPRRHIRTFTSEEVGKLLDKKTFKSRYGYMGIDNVNVRFKKYIHAVLGSDMREHHLYDMRHTFATLLITEKHVDVMTVSKLMGHSSIETTLKYYTHTTGNRVTWSLSISV